jgi:hypothetical protein
LIILVVALISTPLAYIHARRVKRPRAGRLRPGAQTLIVGGIVAVVGIIFITVGD